MAPFSHKALEEAVHDLERQQMLYDERLTLRPTKVLFKPSVFGLSEAEAIEHVRKLLSIKQDALLIEMGEHDMEDFVRRDFQQFLIDENGV
jgi:hypothetical protein